MRNSQLLPRQLTKLFVTRGLVRASCGPGRWEGWASTVQKCGCGTHSLEGRRGLVAVLGWYMMGLGPQLGLPLPGLPLVLLSSFRGGCNLEESNGGAGHPPPRGCDLGAGSHGCGPRAMIGFTWCSRSADGGLCTFWVLTAPRSAPPLPGLTVHMVFGRSLEPIVAPGESHSHQSISHTCQSLRLTAFRSFQLKS